MSGPSCQDRPCFHSNRVAAHDVKLQFEEAVADPTPLEELDVRSLPEQTPRHCPSGGAAPGKSGTGRARQTEPATGRRGLPGQGPPDLWNKLKPGQCHVAANGKEVVGKAWPAGCHLTLDVQGAQVGFPREVPKSGSKAVLK